LNLSLNFLDLISICQPMDGGGEAGVSI